MNYENTFDNVVALPGPVELNEAELESVSGGATPAPVVAIAVSIAGFGALAVAVTNAYYQYKKPDEQSISGGQPMSDPSKPTIPPVQKK